MSAPDQGSADAPTIDDEIGLWSEYHGIHMSHRAADDLAAMIRRLPANVWRAEWEREARLRLDAEATARGLRWAGGLLVAGWLGLMAMVGTLAAVDRGLDSGAAADAAAGR